MKITVKMPGSTVDSIDLNIGPKTTVYEFIKKLSQNQELSLPAGYSFKDFQLQTTHLMMTMRDLIRIMPDFIWIKNSLLGSPQVSDPLLDLSPGHIQELTVLTESKNPVIFSYTIHLPQITAFMENMINNPDEKFHAKKLEGVFQLDLSITVPLDIKQFKTFTRTIGESGIKHLRLHYRHFDSDSLDALAIAIHRNHHLEILDLGASKITNPRNSHALALAIGASQLKTLYMHNVSLDGMEQKRFAQALKSNRTLTELTMINSAPGIWSKTFAENYSIENLKLIGGWDQTTRSDVLTFPARNQSYQENYRRKSQEYTRLSLVMLLPEVLLQIISQYTSGLSPGQERLSSAGTGLFSSPAPSSSLFSGRLNFTFLNTLLDDAKTIPIVSREGATHFMLCLKGKSEQFISDAVVQLQVLFQSKKFNANVEAQDSQIIIKGVSLKQLKNSLPGAENTSSNSGCLIS